MSTEEKEFNPALMTERRTYTAKPKAAVRSERLFMQVTGYETPADSAHYAVGHKIGYPDSLIKVRLNTIEERVVDAPTQTRDKITLQYATGTNIRDSIAAKAKDGITLLSFDDAKFIRKNDDGYAEFRAHWPKTMSLDPEAEVISARAHIHLVRDDAPVGKAGAYVEVVRGATPATAENIDALLLQSLKITDDQGRPRDPSLALRVTFNGDVSQTARVYPSKVESSTFDQLLGKAKKIYINAPAENSVDNLLNGPVSAYPLNNRSMDIVRAVVAGLKQEPLQAPLFVASGTVPAHIAKAHAQEVENTYLGVKKGLVIPEVVFMERINFGPEAAKTYLKDSHLYHLSVYAKMDTVAENAVSRTAMYTATTVAIQRHDDGAPYAVFASPNQMGPFMGKIGSLRLSDASFRPKAPEASADNAAVPVAAAVAVAAVAASTEAPAFAAAPVADSVPEIEQPTIAAFDGASSAFDGEDAQPVIADDSPNYDDIPF